MQKPLRFHWSLSQAGNKFRRAQATQKMSGTPSLVAQLALCQQAERCGIDSMLMAIGFTRPDPLLLAVALGQRTERINFMVACRSGLLSPATFVQQVNTASALVNGRIHINIVSGHTPRELQGYGDFLNHDERYERTDEFLTVCHAFWQGDAVNFSGKHYRIEEGQIKTPFVSAERPRPEIFLGGNSAKAAALAAAHADCLWRFPDVPSKLAKEVEPILAAGKEVGLLVSLIARPTQDEAQQASRSLIAGLGEESRAAHREFARNSDSEGFNSNYDAASRSEWLTPVLWCGAVPYLGAPAIALVGSYDQIVDALEEYRAVGVTQYLFMGWPDEEEMERFGRDLLPFIHARGLLDPDAARATVGK